MHYLFFQSLQYSHKFADVYRLMYNGLRLPFEVYSKQGSQSFLSTDKFLST